MDQFYLYKFEDAERSYHFANIAHEIEYDGETYAPSSISHSPPTFSSDPSQARITVHLRDDLQVAMNYISHPPPFKTLLAIWEVMEVTEAGNTLIANVVDAHWRGQIVRIAWRDNFRRADMTCKTRHDIHFARETNNESLNPLCRFHLGDGRCPVNIEDFKETATVSAKSADISEPTLTVTGLAQVNAYYVPGMVRLANQDWRTVIAAASGVLTLSRAFPDSSVQIGDTVDVFAGDDLTIETCSVKFGAQTNSGEAWGGWKLTPNRDYQRFGINGA